MEKKKNRKKNVVLGVTGGIAAYKSAELVRLLKKCGYDIKVIMTRNATRFISPLTLAILSENKVYTSLFSQNEEDDEIRHISLAHWADLILIAPATANVIARIAHGMADDLLTSTILAFPGDIILAPSMNSTMLQNIRYQENRKILLQMGFHFISTEKGMMACGDYGDGRMAGPEEIVKMVNRMTNPTYLLEGKRLLITASATREPIDMVRFISNYSTGKMGFALAEVARNRGGEVILITGPTHLEDIGGVKTIHVNTAREMRDQVLNYLNDSDIFISAAAVSDFCPVNYFSGKIKKDTRKKFNITLEKNVDILKEAGEKKTSQILVGFAAEVDHLEEYATSKLKSKNLDYIIVNDISREDSGFGTDSNKVFIIDRKGRKTDLPLMSKFEVAEHIFDMIHKDLAHQDKGISIE